MKLNGLGGKGSGKLGAHVFVVRKGEQIVREYNDKVYNPKSGSQTEQRAKFKLMSQLAAIFGGVIAIPSEGNVSARNKFTAANIGEVTYSEGTASIDLTDIKVTKSVVALPAVVPTATAGAVSVGLAVGDEELNAMVYIFMQKTADNLLRYVASTMYTTPGADNRYVYGRNMAAGNYVVYAYGVRYNTELGKVRFEDIEVPTAESVAKLIAQRVVTSADYTLSETVAADFTIGA